MGNAVADALNKGLKLADTGCRFMELKSEIAGAAINKTKAARKLMLKARYSAEEFADTATLAIRKHPVKAVCGTFVTAFLIGGLAVRLARRSS